MQIDGNGAPPGVGINSILQHIDAGELTNAGSRIFADMAPSVFFDEFYENEKTPAEVIRDLHVLVTFGYESLELAKGGKVLHPGEYRSFCVTAGKWYPPLPDDVPEIMDVFTKKLDELVKGIISMDDIDSASRLVKPLVAFAGIGLETIHPFEDGNGRTGRALMDYVEYFALRKLGYKVEEIEAYQARNVSESDFRYITRRSRFTSDDSYLLHCYLVPITELMANPDGPRLTHPRDIVSVLRSFHPSYEDKYFNAIRQKMLKRIAGFTIDKLSNPPWSTSGVRVANKRELAFGEYPTTPVTQLKAIDAYRRSRGVSTIAA